MYKFKNLVIIERQCQDKETIETLKDHNLWFQEENFSYKSNIDKVILFFDNTKNTSIIEIEKTFPSGDLIGTVILVCDENILIKRSTFEKSRLEDQIQVFREYLVQSIRQFCNIENEYTIFLENIQQKYQKNLRKYCLISNTKDNSYTFKTDNLDKTKIRVDFIIDTPLQDLGNYNCSKETQTLNSSEDLYPKPSSFSNNIYPNNPKPFGNQNTPIFGDPFGLNQPNFGVSQRKNPFGNNPSSSFEQNTSFF